MKTKLKSILAVALCAVGFAAFAEPKQEVSAVSAEGFLDLTVGDRVAAVPEELVVVDPAWGDAKTAKVDFNFGASTVETRTYNSKSNDLWQTTTLTPGRYTLALTAGTEKGSAAFWKTDSSWVIFDSSNITADVTFEADKTYLMLGTNTVSGKTLTVTDGAKFAYGEGAGFLGGTVAELPKRYGKLDLGDGLYQIVEKIKGCADNPWEVGVGVEAYTNGTELVIVGKGTIADLSEISKEVKDGIAAITVADATDAAAGTFYGFDKVAVTLPDNWQGELPDERDTWCGATGATLTRMPMAVRQVKVQQRYPWNGLVDVTYDVSGTGMVKVTVSVTVDGKKLAKPTVTGGTTVDLGTGKELKDLRLTWDAKADFKDEKLHEKIRVKLTIAPLPAGQLWEDGPIWANCNVGATKPEESGYCFWWGDTIGYVHDGEKWVSADGQQKTIEFDNIPPANTCYNKDAAAFVDGNGNLKSDYDAATAHRGAPWRMMTHAEMEKLRDKSYCTWTWVDDYKGTGVTGYIVKGAKDPYKNSEVFFPTTGFGQGSDLIGTLNGGGGYYWTSTPPTFDNLSGYFVSFNKETCGSYFGFRYRGHFVRPVRDAE